MINLITTQHGYVNEYWGLVMSKFALICQDCRKSSFKSGDGKGYPIPQGYTRCAIASSDQNISQKSITRTKRASEKILDVVHLPRCTSRSFWCPIPKTVRGIFICYSSRPALKPVYSLQDGDVCTSEIDKIRISDVFKPLYNLVESLSQLFAVSTGSSVILQMIKATL